MYDATPVPGYNGGKFTLNTSLINNGATISATSQLYFRISALYKYAGDPLQPDALGTADNGAGKTGDIQTVNLAGVNLGTGQFIPVPFTILVGTQNTFTIGLDLYMVPSGSAMITSEMLVRGADGTHLQNGITTGEISCSLLDLRYRK